MTPKNNDLTQEPAAAEQAETPREKFERERMNRRAALAKIGLRAGATAFALFAVDDIARLVMGRMAENKEMGRIANSLGREFKNAGVAFADDEDITVTCKHCTDQACLDNAPCVQNYVYCAGCTNKSIDDCYAVYHTCTNNASYNYVQCAAAHCPDDNPLPPCPAVPNLPCLE